MCFPAAGPRKPILVKKLSNDLNTVLHHTLRLGSLYQLGISAKARTNTKHAEEICVFIYPPTISKVFTAYSLLFFFQTNATRNQRPSFPGTGIAKHVFRCTSEEELCPGTKKQKIKTDIVLAERHIHVISYFTNALTSVKRHRVNSKSIDPCSSEEGYSIYALGKLSVCRHMMYHQRCRLVRRPELFRLSARQVSCNNHPRYRPTSIFTAFTVQ